MQRKKPVIHFSMAHDTQILFDHNSTKKYPILQLRRLKQRGAQSHATSQVENLELHPSLSSASKDQGSLAAHTFGERYQLIL